VPDVEAAEVAGILRSYDLDDDQSAKAVAGLREEIIRIPPPYSQR
jgi:hypothetical protein